MLAVMLGRQHVLCVLGSPVRRVSTIWITVLLHVLLAILYPSVVA